MKPHHYFWISIYAILFWLVKLFFIELLPFEWWKELLIIDLISFIFIAIAFGDDEPNKRSVSRQIDLTFCIFTNVFGVLFWGIEESLKIYKNPISNLTKNVIKFNHWIDKLFEKQNKQKKSN